MKVEMRKIGSTLAGKTRLQYYIYHTENRYGICIKQIKTETACGTVDGGYRKTIRLADSLLRHRVFPQNLPEILEDYSCAD
ncbi:MAG: DUF6514 family protein [Oscillospiraceae bacterium]|jgi:hypothetical protein|nr:DUF6514 family protein [Oscillospiraceae bacterium]